MTAVSQQVRPVGQQLRFWRERRHLSQLDLSIQAEVSTRHLSFVETGRSTPSRDMVLRLAEHLDVPLRDRNPLLVAAGYAPVYAETGIDSPVLTAVRAAVRLVLVGHEPYPAFAVDRGWNIVDSNSSGAILTDGVAPELLEPPANALRITLHPDGMASRIANLGEWRGHLLGRLRRQVAQTADADLEALYGELSDYPCAQRVPEVELPGPGDVMVPLRMRHCGEELAFLSTIATFGTPLDITVAELAIEAFYPADEHTASIVRAQLNDSQGGCAPQPLPRP